MSSTQQIVVRLAEQEEALWLRFAPHTNEMALDPRGRRIFPKLDYKIEGLDAEKMYEMFLEIHQVDDHRYKFCDGQWVENGRSRFSSMQVNWNAKKIRHVDGAKTGKEWMKFAVKFDHVKITNRLKETKPTNIVLHSLHKYVPVLSIIEVSSISKPVAAIKIYYTQFIAVTKYQNPAVRFLKFATNGLSQQHLYNNLRRFPSSEVFPKIDLTPPIPTMLPPQFFAPNPFMLPNYTVLMQTMAPFFNHVGGFLGAATSSIPSIVDLTP